MSEPTIGSTPFQIDLEQLGDAVQSVVAQAGRLKELVGSMRANLRFISAARPTPPSAGGEPLEQRFGDVAGQLSDLLDEISSRLQLAYRGYAAAEHTDVGDTGGRKEGTDGRGR